MQSLCLQPNFLSPSKMKHICNKLTLILLLAISQDITQCFSCALLVIATYRSLAREVMGVILYSAQLFFFFAQLQLCRLVKEAISCLDKHTAPFAVLPVRQNDGCCALSASCG